MSTHRSVDPERLDLVWGRSPARRRGPKPSLSVDQIARAAIELADATGLEAVSMKRLAEVLNVGTMTLYTYVPDKATLLQLMPNSVIAEVAAPDAPEDWRDHLRQSAEALLELYLGHPWMMQINIEGPPVTPSQVRFLESLLQALQCTGLSRRESLDVAMSLSYFVLGAAKLTTGILQADRESSLSVEEVQANHADVFGRLLDPTEFPLVLEAITASSIEAPSPDIWDYLGFRFGLDRLIDGIAAYIDARS